VQPRIELNYGSDPEDERLPMEASALLEAAEVKPMANSISASPGLSEKVVGRTSSSDMRANVRPTFMRLVRPDWADGDNCVLTRNAGFRRGRNLYVVDASVFPIIPSAVPNLT
jgi:hypothetical protein